MDSENKGNIEIFLLRILAFLRESDSLGLLLFLGMLLPKQKPLVKTEYQVGGSLSLNAPYVQRKADEDLYQALRAGKFCYVFNCRQMGKSSLRVQMVERLKSDNISSVSLDLTTIGTEEITQKQWYGAIIKQLHRGLKLTQTVNLKTWLKDSKELSPLQLLYHYLEEIILKNIEAERLVIFIDEIDSVRDLPFDVSDFFALIRACYNLRVDNPDYEKINFVLLGVATPSGLIEDANKTPFNIGEGIELGGLEFEKAGILVQGLKHRAENPRQVLREIINWTGGQPFLTQKLCQIVKEYQGNIIKIAEENRGKIIKSEQEEIGKIINPGEAFQEESNNLKQEDSHQKNINLEANNQANIIKFGEEKERVEEIVRYYLIENWQSNDEPVHFKTIETRLLKDEERKGRLLGFYQKILQDGSINWDGSLEQQELQLAGLVVKKGNQLSVYNPIYQGIFSLEWVEKELGKLRPDYYREAIKAWLESDKQDESYFLRGQALEKALVWKRERRLSEEDEQFLDKSRQLEQQETERLLEIQKQEREILKAANQKANRRIRIGSIFLIISLIVAGLAVVFANKAEQERKIAIAGTQLEQQGTSILQRFRTGNQEQIESLLEAMETGQKLYSLVKNGRKLSDYPAISPIYTLHTILQNIREKNKFKGHQSYVYSLSFSSDSKNLATGSGDGTARLWDLKGKLIATLDHQGSVYSLVFSPDGDYLATGSDDGFRLWNLNGNQIVLFKNYKSFVNSAVFSPDGKYIATGSGDGIARLWDLKGELIATLDHQGSVYSVVFSPNGDYLATGSDDGFRLWDLKRNQIALFKRYKSSVKSVAFSPDGKYLAIGSDDGFRLWNLNGNQIVLFKRYKSSVNGVTFSPDGKYLIITTTVEKVQLLDLKGNLITEFQGGGSFAISPNGQYLATGAEDFIDLEGDDMGTVRLWALKSNQLTIPEHRSSLNSVVFSPDGKYLATGSEDGLRLWDLKENQMALFKNYQSSVHSVAFSPNSKYLATGSGNFLALEKNDQYTARLWDLKGNQLAILEHPSVVNSVAFSPNGKYLATGSEDGLRLWNWNENQRVVFKTHQSSVKSLAFSPDGKHLATGSKDGLRFWDLKGNQLAILKHQDSVKSIAFSPDGKYLATGLEKMEKNIRLWDLKGNQLAVFTGHQDSVKSIAFSPDGEYLATGSEKNARLWDLKGNQLAVFKTENEGFVSSVAFSPDGEYLATGYGNYLEGNGTVRLWNVEGLEELLARGCHWLNDYLTIHSRQPQVQKVKTICDTSNF